MKVALLISGQPRYIRECYPSIKEHLLDAYDCDIYSHLWWDDSYIGKKFKFHATDTYSENMRDLFMELYKPLHFKFEPQKEFDISEYRTDVGEMAHDLGNTPTRDLWGKEVILKQLSMWYSALQAFNLYENYRYEYDAVVRLRTDLLLTKELNLRELKHDILYLDDFENKQQLCDWFAVTKSPQKMWNYHQAYKHIPDFSNNGVARSTTLLQNTLNLYGTQITIKDLGVRIYREYQEPRSMSEYNNDNPDLFPYWYIARELK